MSPVLDPKPHHITPLSVQELQKLALDYGETPDRIVNSATIKDEFSGLAIKMSMLISESDDSGVIVLEDTQLQVAIGQVRFETNLNKKTLPTNSIQIKSVYLKGGETGEEGDYRNIGLALSAYEMLSERFTVVSDTEQTEYGAAFWKQSVSQHFQVHIAENFDMPTPNYVLDESGEPIIYDLLRAKELDQIVWGIEPLDNKQYKSVNHSKSESKQNTVLIMGEKHQDSP